jgi:hypothetical protein
MEHRIYRLNMIITDDLLFPRMIHRTLMPVPARHQRRRTLQKAVNQRIEISRKDVMEAMLGQILRRRLGRELSPIERQALKKRAESLRTEQDIEGLRAVRKLPADAILAWLLGPAPR